MPGKEQQHTRPPAGLPLCEGIPLPVLVLKAHKMVGSHIPEETASDSLPPRSQVTLIPEGLQITVSRSPEAHDRLPGFQTVHPVPIQRSWATCPQTWAGWARSL